MSVKKPSFCASLGHATQQQKPLTNPWFGICQAKFLNSPLVWRSVFSQTVVSETGRWLLTEEHIVRDVMSCAIYAGILKAQSRNHILRAIFRPLIIATSDDSDGTKHALTSTCTDEQVPLASSTCICMFGRLAFLVLSAGEGSRY